MKKRTLAFMAIVAALCILFLFLFQRENSKADHAQGVQRAELHPPKSVIASIDEEKSKDTPESVVADKVRQPPMPNRGRLLSQWIDEICPPLSEEEERAILDKHGRRNDILLGLAAQGSSNAKEYIKEALGNNKDDLLAVQLAIAFKVLDTENEEASSVLKSHIGKDKHLDLIAKLRAYLRGEEPAISGQTDYEKGESEIKNAKLLASEVLQLAGRNKERSDLRSFYTAAGEGSLLYHQFHIIARQADNIKNAELLANLAHHFIEYTENRAGLRIDDIEIAYIGEKRVYAAAENNGLQIEFANGGIPHSGEQLKEEMVSMKEYERYANNRDEIVLALTEGELAEFSKTCIASGEPEAFSVLKNRRPELFLNLSGGIVRGE